MAKGGKASLKVNFTQIERNLKVALSRVERGTKRATIAASEEILAMSYKEVPKETLTLAKSAYYEIQGKYRNFTSVIGYGGRQDPVNPKTGRRASSYMVVVHEDLHAIHLNGKAKFLEDPVRAYQSKFSPRVASFIRTEL